MAKLSTKKVLVAHTIVRDSIEGLEMRLGETLGAKAMAAVQRELDTLKTATRLLESGIRALDPEFKAKLDKYMNLKK